MSTSPRFAASVAVVLACTALACASSIPVGDQIYQRYEWRASTFTFSAQHQATLDVAPDGQVVAVWSSRRQQEGRAGVYAQRFTADGVVVGSETPVALWRQSHQTDPAVAVDAQGNTWVVWQSHDQDGHAGGIFARRFDTSFVGGSEIAVNEQWHGHQAHPVVATWPSGTAVVVWTSVPTPNEPVRLCGRLLAADGQPLGDEFSISGLAQRAEMTPSVACTPDGGFAVVYSVFDEVMKPAGIRMQLFDERGQRLGAEIDVPGAFKESQIEPVIAATTGGYVVAWLDAESDGSDYGILARRFDTQGRALADAFVVNTTRDGPQNAAAVAAARDGRFTIAWNSTDGNDVGVFAQAFAADSTALGGEFRINGHTAGPQALQAATGTRRLVYGPQNELLCVWGGDANLGDSSAVQVTLLTPRSLELADRRQGVTADMQPADITLSDASGAEPHRPPTFDPRTIDYAEREIRYERTFGFTGIVNTGWTPPDPHMAVGPNHIVVMTNGAIAFYTKDGTLTFQDQIEGASGFWGSLGTSDFVFDPEVLYDELSGRFFAMAAEAYAPPSQSRSYVLVAVSDDSDPNGTWFKYRFDTTTLAGNLFDSPNIAVDANVVYVTGDGFGHSANYPVYTFDKASLLVGSPPAIQRSTTMPTSTQSAGIPPVSYDAPPAEYLIEHGENSSNTTVRLIALRNPLSSPTFTYYSLTVPAYGPPENPPQQGTSVRPETFDARFWSVAYRNGSLWATHHVNSTRVRARWYQIDMRGWPNSGNNPVLVQSGELDLGGTVRTFFCAITVNDRGDAAMTASRSSPTSYISMITAYRRASDPLGTMTTPVIEHNSVGPDTSGRWGDYGAVAADPTDLDVFWAHHEYGESGSWRTWVAQVQLPRLLGDMNCDGAVDNFDITPFVLALNDPTAYGTTYVGCNILHGDVNGDGNVDNFDITPFVALLSGR